MVEAEVTFDATAHSADAIQRAAYKFLPEFSLDLTNASDQFRCTLRFTDTADVESVVDDFRKEVLDQTLRERIRSETEDVRNLILALAFSKTSLADL
jgi:His-Xaa-Ser system protein HxsD